MGWLVFFAVIILLISLFFIWVRIIIQYEDTVRLSLRILFVTIPLYPAKQKKIRLSDYSRKKLRQPKKTAKKKKKTPAKKQAQPTTQDTLQNIPSTLRMIQRIIVLLTKKFLRYLKLDVTTISIQVACEDAAKTAILYGTILQAVAYLMEFLSTITTVRYARKSQVGVIPDFVSGTPEIKIHIGFRLRVWHFLALAFSAAKEFLKNKK